MKTILLSLLKTFGTQLFKLILSLLSTIKEVFKYLNNLKKEKKEQKIKEEVNKYNEKLKEACDNGSIEDLLNL
jgi:hypothetical protein